MRGVKTPQPVYVQVLNDMAAIREQLDRLETHVLQLMNESGITDEAIGIVQDLSSQRVGQKRRRRFNNSKKHRA
jgi:hypothetical protein